MLGGRARFKRFLAKTAPLDCSSLPYREPLVEWLREQARAGRPAILITAADQSIANSVQEHLQIFDKAIGSDGTQNLKGRRKRELLDALFGPKNYVYAGDSRSDLAVWDGASAAVLIGPAVALAPAVQRAGTSIERSFASASTGWRTYLRQIRLHQWAKNLLVFLPLALAHRLSDLHLLGQTALGFAGFSLAASGGYVLNDLLDLKNDRSHHKKCQRPLASGAIPIATGLAMSAGLLCGGLALVFTVSAVAAGCLLAYVSTSLAYSLCLKKRDIVDVLTLAALYTSRLIFGGVISRIHVSIWLAGFSIFMFLNLAFGKRACELRSLEMLQKRAASGRGYLVTDRPMIETMGICSGFISVLVLVLYMNSAEVAQLYSNSWLLWLIPPLVLFWVMRFWMYVERGLMTEDPLAFALKDKVSFGIGLIAALVVRLAI